LLINIYLDIQYFSNIFVIVTTVFSTTAESNEKRLKIKKEGRKEGRMDGWKEERKEGKGRQRHT